MNLSWGEGRPENIQALGRDKLDALTDAAKKVLIANSRRNVVEFEHAIRELSEALREVAPDKASEVDRRST